MNEDDKVEDGQEAEPTSLKDDLEAEYDRLASDETETEAVEEAVEEEVEVEEDDEPDETEEDEEPAALEPLQHWPNEWKERFSALDDTGKEYVLELHKGLEQAHSTRSQELADREKRFARLEEIDSAFEPHRQNIALTGMSDVQVVKQLLAYSDALNRDPAGTLRALAQQYGVDFSSPQTETDEDEFIDPAAAQRIQNLESQLNQLKTGIDQDRTAAQSEHTNQLQAQIDAFKDAKDDGGNPKHPHFDAVRAHMGGLMQTGAATSIEAAYEQAVWANPTLRAQLIEEQSKATAKETNEKRKADVKKAKQAGRTVKSRGEPDGARAPAKTHKEEATRIYDELASG